MVNVSSISLYFLLVSVGGVLFKVYIVGEAIKVVKRFSLPDVTKPELSKNAGVYRFPRVSCAAASADEADLDPCVGGEIILLVHTDYSIQYMLHWLVMWCAGVCLCFSQGALKTYLYLF